MQLDDARREVARLHEILLLLNAHNCLPPHWEKVRPFPPSGADQVWRDAFAALEGNTDAQLP